MNKVRLIDAFFAVGAIVLVAMALVEFSPSEGDRAAEVYEQTRIAGASAAQLCRSAQVVEQKYRADGEGSKADQWKLYAQIDCSGAYFKEGYRY